MNLFGKETCTQATGSFFQLLIGKSFEKSCSGKSVSGLVLLFEHFPSKVTRILSALITMLMQRRQILAGQRCYQSPRSHQLHSATATQLLTIKLPLKCIMVEFSIIPFLRRMHCYVQGFQGYPLVCDTSLNFFIFNLYFDTDNMKRCY